MSLTLGPQAYDAIQRLKGNSDWRAFVAALELQMSELMHRAIEPTDNRIDNGGYARAIRDLVSAIGQNEAPSGTRVQKYPVKPQREAAHV